MFEIEDLKDCTSIDLNTIKDFAEEWMYNNINSDNAPYKLLAYIASKYNNITIYDLGTFRGWSSLALATNPTNKVISYDIQNYLAVKQMDNIEYKIGNFYEDTGLLNSPLISLDIDPHDGPAETKFINWLIENNYKGTVICDDIKLNEGMKIFWNSIENVEKHDVSEYGHKYGGTGILIFK